LESVIPEHQQKIIYERLEIENPSAAAMFWLALNTGLRLNELLGEPAYKPLLLTLKNLDLTPLGLPSARFPAIQFCCAWADLPPESWSV